VYLEPVRKQRPPSDDPATGLRLGMLALIALILFAVLGFRLWFLQILSGDEYVAQANNNRVRTVDIQAPRGVIYDRNMDPLVKNRAGLSVGILPMDLPEAASPERGRVFSRLAQLLTVPVEDIRSKVERAEKTDQYRVCIIREDVPEDTIVAYLKEHSIEFPGVRVEKSYLREYPRKAFATHVLGYVGEISENQLAEEQFRVLKAGAQVGKDGVEEVYDQYLRGTDGSRKVEVDAAGRPKRVLDLIEPVPGSNLVLTIDNTIQEAAERAVANGIEMAHSAGFKNAAAGAVVAIDPRNGEILAMTSFPDYDPSLWVGGMSASTFAQLNSAEANNPLFNRAVKGQYPAGSTFKPFVAAAALRQDVISWDTKFNCTGNFKEGEQVWKCWNTDGHGELNLVEALEQSCDVYFYNVGKLLYDQREAVLQAGVRDFGFGSGTGVDLPGELVPEESPYPGRVPDATWKQEHYTDPIDKLYKTGDDINMAIGQGDLLVTPLQLGMGFAAIANADRDGKEGGQVLVPHLAKQVTDAAGNAIHTFETKVAGTVTMNPEDLEAIRKGLVYSTTEPLGTAYKAFKTFPITVAGKTGTAQKAPDDDYALFMGYAPADNPEILVVAVIEQGGSSSITALVARQVMEAYFRTGTEIPTDLEVTH
jgi:penicillin-binding protein 2